MSGRRLVVVPTDPIERYEEKGLDGIADYYNPSGFFDEVHALSPAEAPVERFAHGLRIRGVRPEDFRSALAQIRPQLVRAYGGHWTAALACHARLPGVPVVVSVHDPNPEMCQPVIRLADRVWCMSSQVTERARHLGCTDEQLRLLPNRVDLTRFRPGARDESASPFEGPADSVHILHVGRGHEQKNPDTLIRALALLPERYRCTFIGIGGRGAYRPLAKRLGVVARCRWIDSVPNRELPVWYARCDCFCVPSRWEGFGLVFIEAAACGAPIVTSDIAPQNEMLESDRTAVLVARYEEPSELAAAIRRACEDPALERALRQHAREAALPFSRAAVDAAEVALYREALEIPTSLRRRTRDRLRYAAWRGRRELRRWRAGFRPGRARELPAEARDLESRG